MRSHVQRIKKYKTALVLTVSSSQLACVCKWQLQNLPLLVFLYPVYVMVTFTLSGESGHLVVVEHFLWVRICASSFEYFLFLNPQSNPGKPTPLLSFQIKNLRPWEEYDLSKVTPGGYTTLSKSHYHPELPASSFGKGGSGHPSQGCCGDL